jgi:uncharacterized protein
VALVTGASSGIGEAIARELASRGYGLALAARREERLVTLGDELSGRHGVRAEPIACDVTTAAGRDALAERVADAGLEVEILVNNAGFGGGGNVAGADRERLVEMVQVNCEAVLDMQARYLPGMVERDRGAVMNIASMAAFQPIPGTATYAATKAFVLSLSEAIHAELAGTEVTVTAVCPGPVRTEFTTAAGIEHAEDRGPEMIWMSAEDVARAAVEGTRRGKRVVVPGVLQRATALSGQHAPRALGLPIAKRIWKRAL